jgi:DNA polymerase I-like protein with 3'-5' exonuclease and polymerase domains
MNIQQLFDSLSERSLQVRLRKDGRLEVVGNVKMLTDTMIESLQRNRQLFLNLFAKEVGPDQGLSSVRLGDKDFEFSIWESRDLLRSPIAIDTETELIDGFRVPGMALASVSDGVKHRLIKPEDLQSFIDQHSKAHFVAHNASFDFAVIRDTLEDPLAWFEVAQEGRLHDTMILDSLIRLGRDDSFPSPRNLGTLASLYLGVVIDKDDPFRLRYGEILDRPWALADPGFFRYAIKDAIATRKLWDVLTAIAADMVKPFKGQLLPEASRRYGLLTESLQVRGAIALAEIERNGIALDQVQVEATKTRLSDEVKTLIDKLNRLEESEGLFKVTKSGELVLTASLKPAINQGRLCEILEGIAEELSLEDVPRTGKTLKVSCSVKFWGQYAEQAPFLSLWVQLEEVAKLCQFFAGLRSDRIHPRYTAIVRTGRTSCHGPNIQQLPRSGGFREMIVPSEGSLFLGVDYAAIELRTLAAVLEHRYGRSQLATVIREGIDPHAFTASMFRGVSLEEFSKLPDRKQLRQQAKALNFGIPGGLGAKSLVAYAASTYGVDMSLEEATLFRDRLIGEVYPELAEYLKDDSIEALSYNLKTSGFRVRSCFDTDGALGAAKRIIAGKGRASGAEYGEAFVDRVWDSLKGLNENRKLADRIAQREAGEQLSRDLFFGPVITLTGRLRGKVGFSQSRNTPFQGIAADGAKLALWGLYRAGFRVVAFIHDEVLIELPIDSDHTTAASRIDRILCESMEQLTGSVPVACEYSLSNRWYKASEAVFDENGKLCVWSPEK